MSVPSSELGPPPPPISQASVPPRNQRERNTIAYGWGGGGSQFGRLEKKPRPPAGEGGPNSDDWRKSLARLRVRGWGSQFGRLEKKPSTLSTLWRPLSSIYGSVRASAYGSCMVWDGRVTVCAWECTKNRITDEQYHNRTFCDANLWVILGISVLAVRVRLAPRDTLAPAFIAIMLE
jgi:hypothetical protein